jgi:hypothetical protein
MYVYVFHNGCAGRLRIQTNYDKCSGCDVHKGFYTTYNSQNASIKALVSTASTNLVSHRARDIASLPLSLSFSSAVKHCPSCYQLTVTGHSLGAALATLAAVDLATTLPYSSLLVFLYAARLLACKAVRYPQLQPARTLALLGWVTLSLLTMRPP